MDLASTPGRITESCTKLIRSNAASRFGSVQFIHGVHKDPREIPPSRNCTTDHRTTEECPIYDRK